MAVQYEDLYLLPLTKIEDINEIYNKTEQIISPYFDSANTMYSYSKEIILKLLELFVKNKGIIFIEFNQIQQLVTEYGVSLLYILKAQFEEYESQISQSALDILQLITSNIELGNRIEKLITQFKNQVSYMVVKETNIEVVVNFVNENIQQINKLLSSHVDTSILLKKIYLYLKSKVIFNYKKNIEYNINVFIINIIDVLSNIYVNHKIDKIPYQYKFTRPSAPQARPLSPTLISTTSTKPQQIIPQKPIEQPVIISQPQPQPSQSQPQPLQPIIQPIIIEKTKQQLIRSPSEAKLSKMRNEEMKILKNIKRVQDIILNTQQQDKEQMLSNIENIRKDEEQMLSNIENILKDQNEILTSVRKQEEVIENLNLQVKEQQKSMKSIESMEIDARIAAMEPPSSEPSSLESSMFFEMEQLVQSNISRQEQIERDNLNRTIQLENSIFELSEHIIKINNTQKEIIDTLKYEIEQKIDDMESTMTRNMNALFKENLPTGAEEVEKNLTTLLNKQQLTLFSKLGVAFDSLPTNLRSNEIVNILQNISSDIDDKMSTFSKISSSLVNDIQEATSEVRSYNDGMSAITVQLAETDRRIKNILSEFSENVKNELNFDKFKDFSDKMAAYQLSLDDINENIQKTIQNNIKTLIQSSIDDNTVKINNNIESMFDQLIANLDQTVINSIISAERDKFVNFEDTISKLSLDVSQMNNKITQLTSLFGYKPVKAKPKVGMLPARPIIKRSKRRIPFGPEFPKISKLEEELYEIEGELSME